MKNALRILIAAAVATMFVGGGLAGTVAASTDQEAEIEQDIEQDVEQSVSDDDLLDLSVNAGNPTAATATNAANVGSGSQTAMASADSYNNAGDEFELDAELEGEQEAEIDQDD